MQPLIAVLLGFGVTASIFLESFLPIGIIAAIVLFVFLINQITVPASSIATIFKNKWVWILLVMLIPMGLTSWNIINPNPKENTKKIGKAKKGKTETAEIQVSRRLWIKDSKGGWKSFVITRFQKSDADEIIFTVSTRNGERRFQILLSGQPGIWFDQNGRKRGTFYLSMDIKKGRLFDEYYRGKGWREIQISTQNQNG